MKSGQNTLYVVQKNVGIYDVATWSTQPSNTFLRKIQALPETFDFNAYSCATSLAKSSRSF